MSDDADGVHELVDAATAHVARRNVALAVAALAASPLDEQAADLMRAALARAGSPTVQRAASRISSLRGTPATKLVCLPAAVEEDPPQSPSVADRDASYRQLGPLAELGDVG